MVDMYSLKKSDICFAVTNIAKEYLVKHILESNKESPEEVLTEDKMKKSIRIVFEPFGRKFV